LKALKKIGLGSFFLYCLFNGHLGYASYFPTPAGNQKHSSYSDKSQLYNRLSATYVKTNPELGYAFAIMALNTSVKNNNRPQGAISYFNIASYFRTKDLNSEAIRYYKKSIANFYELKDLNSVTLCLNTMGELYYKTLQLDEAIKCYKENIVVHPDSKNFRDIANSYNMLSNIYFLRGEYINAIDYTCKALKLATEKDLNYISTEILSRYSSLYLNTNLTASPDYNKIYKTIKESLSSDNARKRLGVIIAKVELNKTESQNLRQKSYLQEIYLRKQKNYIIILALMAISLIITGVFAYKKYTSNRKTNRILEDKHMELLKANADLYELNATKDKFFSTIEHSIKTPFASIIGYSDLLHHDFEKLSDEEKKNFIKNIMEAGKYTFKFFENLMEWSRLQSGKYEIFPEAFEIPGLIQEQVDELSEQILNKKIYLTTEIPENIMAYADRKMIGLVVINLLSNSIKYTPENGSIKITAVSVNSHAEISIADSGFGISKENMKKIFRIDEHFVRQGTHYENGSGLGLILCYSLININKGEIWAESEPGKGSKFTFSLPLTSI
jgi:signal transduction histidine kinase